MELFICTTDGSATDEHRVSTLAHALFFQSVGSAFSGTIVRAVYRHDENAKIYDGLPGVESLSMNGLILPATICSA